MRRRPRPTTSSPIESTPSRHAGLLSKFGPDPGDLIKQFAGGGALGGLDDKLGL